VLLLLLLLWRLVLRLLLLWRLWVAPTCHGRRPPATWHSILLLVWHHALWASSSTIPSLAPAGARWTSWRWDPHGVTPWWHAWPTP
jgi:hypothetical protein